MLDIESAVTKTIYTRLDNHDIKFDTIEEVINYMKDNPTYNKWETVKYQEITL